MNDDFRFSQRSVRPLRTGLSENERHILRLIHHHAPISRAELGRRTGLAVPTVIRLTDQMLTAGLIKAEQKVMMSGRGQPSLPLLLAPDGAFSLGVSVRADSLSIILVTLHGHVIAQHSETIDATAREVVVARIHDIADELVARAMVDGSRVCGIGLALSGFMAGSPRRVNAPLGMEDWAVGDLEASLGASLGLPVLVENDGSAAAIGEQIYGIGRTVDSFAFVYIDRGLGGGVILDGKPWCGFNGNAGEFTGLLHPDARPRRATLRLLCELLRDDGTAFDSIPEMLAAYDPSWPAINRWVSMVTPQLDQIISAISAVFDPEAIVIGGRMPIDLAERLMVACRFFSVAVRGSDRAFPDLRHSEVKTDAVALGAAALIFQRQFY